MSESSYRQILRSTSIIGGASVVTYIITLLATKLSALILGPSGIGQVGLLNNLMGMCAGVAALGVGTSGTRHLAAVHATASQEQIATARRAIYLACMLLASVGGASVWLAREFIALHVLQEPDISSAVGWVSLGVWLMVAASWPNAILTGSHRVADIAISSVLAAITSTTIIVLALLGFGANGVLAVVLAPPAAAFLVGAIFVFRQPRLPDVHTTNEALISQWRLLASLGGAYLVANLVQTAGYFYVRLEIKDVMTSHGLGIFEAAWVISTIGVNILYKVTGSDYYPRLTALVQNKPKARQLLKEQTAVLLYLATPLVLVISAFSSIFIEIFYSASFSEASNLLKLFVFATFFRVVGYPLGYLVLALAHSRAFLLIEISAAIAFVLPIYYFSPAINFQVIGFSWLGSALIYLAIVYRYAAYSIKVSFRDLDLKYFVFGIFSLAAIYYIAMYSANFSMIVGFLLTLTSAAISFKRLGRERCK